jgi:Tat protein translocase TatB subunit
MLDFGFSEILLTSAIALVVLGPERLPKVARQVGNWMGRARAMARQLTEQLEREVNADELLREQNKPKPPMMNRISQPYVPPPEPPEPQTTLPDLHAVSPDNPHEPLHVHDSYEAASAPQAPPDLHAVAPEPHAPLAQAHVDIHHPPDE